MNGWLVLVIVLVVLVLVAAWLLLVIAMGNVIRRIDALTADVERLKDEGRTVL